MTSATLPLDRPPSAGAAVRKIRVIHLSPWAGPVQDGAAFLAGLSQLDLRARVANPADASLLRMARLDCDWHGEHARAFGAMTAPGLAFLPARVVGTTGVGELLASRPPAGEEWWLVVTGQHPQLLGALAGRVFAALARQGVRILYYAFDEASRAMPCFSEIAPHLTVLIHDEGPLAPSAAALLRADCQRIHRSWVANLVPWAAPFVEAPADRIIFLGSQLGLTAHRQRQITFLQQRYGERFQAFCDHSVPVGERTRLSQFKVSVCPEGRKFSSPAMRATHTDRPFWSGCLGMVPVSEDSAEGGRLEELHRDRLIVRYPHGDLPALARACDQALATPVAERRRIYEHFNRHETVGAVVAAAIAAAGP